MNIRLIGILIASLMVFLSLPVKSSVVCAENCVTKVITDFRGRPPFKRRVETLSATEILQVKVKEVGELTKVRTVDFRGRPPFKRRTELLSKVEMAEIKFSAEEENAKPKRRRVGGSSMFKRRR